VAANLYRRTGGTTPHASTCRAEIEPNTQEDLTLVWTAEKIAGLGVDQVKDLRGNAAKRGAQGIVDLCDAELVRRRARRRTKRSNSSKQIHNGETVHGFHFVCPTEKGITRNQDGTIWTGTWVVDKNHAKRAAKIGAYVALHVAKCQPSYLQGFVRDWRGQEREPTYADGRLVKTKFGIDFLIELTTSLWNGTGMGPVRRDISMANAMVPRRRSRTR